MKDTRPLPSHPELGEHIARARLQRGYVRSKVAEQINVNPSYYSRIEAGIVMPPLVVFASIWRCLQFEPRAILQVLPVQYSEPTRRGIRNRALRDELIAQSSKIGRMLARARVDANLTPEALANAIGVRTRHLARIESGHVLPSLQRFAHLHRVLDLDVERILDRLLGDIPDQPFRRLGNMLRSAMDLPCCALSARSALGSERQMRGAGTAMRGIRECCPPLARYPTNRRRANERTENRASRP